MVGREINTMLCALLTATLLIIASVLAPATTAPGLSFAESASGNFILEGHISAEQDEDSDLPGAAVYGALSSFEVLSAVATPALAAEPSTHEAGQELQLLEEQLLGLLNDERIQRGLASLQVDDRLVLLARGRSSDMAQRNYFSHVTPEGEMVFPAMDARGVTYLLAGENLARNSFPLAESAEVAHKGFMNSPSHRENELEPSFDRVGIGVAFSESGTIYFTELFIASR